MTTTNSSVQVIEARESDIDSLTTILARSFHPTNPYIKKTLPDTPKVREWWYQIFEYEINDPSCHPLIALDPDTEKDIGILTMRLMEPEDRGAGTWTLFPCTEDHDEGMYESMVNSMVEHRERLMLGRKHYLIGLFGVDHGFKGKGVGSALLRRACEIACGVDVFVQANANAKGFYERMGFKVEGKAVMPEDGYEEYMLVRPSQ